MSAGPRLPHADAVEILRAFAEACSLDAARMGIKAVGSLRRRTPDVGDLEIAAPAPPQVRGRIGPEHDELFRLINCRMENSWTDERSPLFAPDATGASPCSLLPPVGRALKGLKPGFLEASIELTVLANGSREAFTLPMQIFRYTPRNMGWVMICRTGPKEYGMWFLGEWKKAHNIPLGDENHKASIDGHLVDAGGNMIDVPTEEEAFRRIGREPLAPHRRAEWIDRLQQMRKGAAR